MAFFSKIYMIGQDGKDGLEDIYVEILQGEGEKGGMKQNMMKKNFKDLGIYMLLFQ